jgi:hypothetical protein
VIRSLRDRGVVAFETKRTGFDIAVIDFREWLPTLDPAAELSLDLDDLDFSDRRMPPALIAREKGQCFYCLQKLDDATTDIEHVMPQAAGPPDHAYRNVVAFVTSERRR